MSWNAQDELAWHEGCGNELARISRAGNGEDLLQAWGYTTHARATIRKDRSRQWCMATITAALGRGATLNDSGSN